MITSTATMIALAVIFIPNIYFNC